MKHTGEQHSAVRVLLGDATAVPGHAVACCAMPCHVTLCPALPCRAVCTSSPPPSPSQVVDLEDVAVADIAAGGWHSMALTADGQIYVWGRCGL